MSPILHVIILPLKPYISTKYSSVYKKGKIKRLGKPAVYVHMQIK